MTNPHMHKFILITFISLNLSCQWFGPNHDSKPPKVADHDIFHTEFLYQSLRPSVADQDGAFGPPCDSMLFTALAVAFGNYKVDLSKWLVEPGKYKRHPSNPCEDSKSSSSKDGAYGRLHAYWSFKDEPWVKKALLDEISYLETHNWVLGEGDKAATDATILIPLYYKMKEKITGEPSRFTASEGLGFRGHLAVLHIWLWGRITGSIPNAFLIALQNLADNQPNNAIFQAVYHLYKDGDQDIAIDLLTKRYPQNRLPTSADWCEFFIYQRDEDNKDWKPCPDEQQTHPAIELAEALGAVRGW